MICSNKNNFVNESFLRLFDYVKKADYEGIDLFDGLNSNLFKNTPLSKSRFFRLCLIQFCKLSPINFRNIFLVHKGFNPKGGALFLLGNLNMFKATGEKRYENEAHELFQRLQKTSIKKTVGIGWGYNFDWQARAFFVPIGTPNIVTSVFVGMALLEYCKVFNNTDALELAKEIAAFIMNEMIILEDENQLCFGYIPGENAQVHNANLMAASFLASLDKYLDNSLQDKIKKSINFSVSAINRDGSWPYGTKKFHKWVDNFHTAFNIESLLNIEEETGASELIPEIENITKYYLNNLFTEDGVPKYYNNKLYPIDIHVLAEVLVVISKIKKSKISYDAKRLCMIEESTLELVKLFQDEKGYFYFQKHKSFCNKIPYIRWGQAWMFYALSCFVFDCKG